VDLVPIGFVESPITDPQDDGWGEVVSGIRLRDSLAPGLRGLEQFSHAMVVFLMHQATFDEATDLVRRPRGRGDMPLLGIFAQRARHRPNPIGVSVVEILGVEGSVLRVRGLDAVDGTPVLDIKPHFPVFDAADEPKVPAWVERLMADYF
jgi:tRNA (adenine37-N6)-methyltransferase